MFLFILFYPSSCLVCFFFNKYQLAIGSFSLGYPKMLRHKKVAHRFDLSYSHKICL